MALGVLALPLMAGAAITASPASLNFAAGETTKTITITPDAGSANQVWTAVSTLSWVTATPASGTFANIASTQLTVNVNTTGVSVGNYNGGLVVAAGTTGAINIPLAITVGAGGPAPTSVAAGNETGLPSGLSPCNMMHTIRGCKTGMQDPDNGAVCNPATTIGCTNCSKVGNIGGAGTCTAETCCILDRIFSVADWVFVILMVVAGMFIIWAAFSFVTSGGNAEKVTSARNKITWAIVGIIIAFLSQGFVRIIVQIVSK